MDLLGSSFSSVASIRFRLKTAHDTAMIQATMQDDDGGVLPLSNPHIIGMMAESQGAVIGYVLGHMGYGDDRHTLIIDTVFLRHTHDTPEMEVSIIHALQDWSITNRYATHIQCYSDLERQAIPRETIAAESSQIVPTSVPAYIPA